MAREAYRSLYGDLTKLKDDSLLSDPAGGGSYDDELFQLLLAVSALVDGYCNRHFYPRAGTLTFDGPADTQLSVPDLVSLTSLTADDDDDGTYETTWAATDYELVPQNASPTEHWGTPYHALRVLGRGTKQRFERGHSRYRVAGVWGYRQHQEDSGSLTDGAITDSATSTAVDSGAHFAVGQTVVVEDEQMLITDISGDALTVRRALNGTTAASHADNTQIDIMRWPAPVERATLINAARIWTRAPAFEPFYVDVDLDTDVRMLLDPYRLTGPAS